MNSQQKKRPVYQEFGEVDNREALERGTPEMPPQKQNLKVQVTRAGRKGKTVTIISGFQTTTEKLTELLKQLKTQCGSGGTIKDNTLEIQGDQGEKLIQILIKLGYKAKLSGG